jgi:hypothetical protein
MPASRTRGAVSIPSSAVLLSLFVFLIAATSVALAKTPSARLDDATRVSVTAVAGNVAVTMAGAAVEVQPESTVSLPARVVTGSDGMLGLTQAGTNITVAGDTDVEIPAEAVDGNLVARLVQHRGNVFYDVAHRDVGKLRVETPYLVAVIKGTQFNVAVQDDSTTISLFEGQLEIRTPDESDVIQLNAGEIAIRSRIDDTIRVVGMNEERVEAPRAAAGRVRDNAVAAVQADTAPAVVRVARDGARANSSAAAPVAASVVTPRAVDLAKDTAPGEHPPVQIASGLDLGWNRTDVETTRATVDLGAANVGVDVARNGAGLEAGVAASVDLGIAGVAAGVDLGAGALDLGVNAGAGVGGITADVGLGANVDLGAGTAAVSLDSGLNVGGAFVADVGLGTALDLGTGMAAVSLDAGLDVGGAVAADVGLSAPLDLGAGAGSVALDTGVTLGGLTADTGLGAGVDLGGGSVDVGLDTGIELGGAPVVDVGLDTSVDLSGGTAGLAADLGVASVDVGLDAGGGLDLGVDLGAADDVVAPVTAPIVPVVETILAPVLGGGSGGGGLLGGLLGRRP